VERDWWLMALLGIVALVGLMLLTLFTLGLLDPELEPEPIAITSEPAIEVTLDPGRALTGIGAATFFLAAALWIIKRTDWSMDEP